MGKFDKLAWEIIHNKPKPRWPERKGMALSGRPKDFLEMETCLRKGGDWELVFPSFLDEFYLHKSADFFDIEPSEYFDNEIRVWLAGVAEYLCHQFKLEVPTWTGKPEYFLPEFWKKSHDDSAEPEFKRRNVGYNPRHLIRL